MNSTRQDRIAGLLLGTAVGDALGLPAEGLSRQRLARLGWNGRWRHRFFFGRGMTSDDTEHTILVAETLLRSRGDSREFARRLAWRLRLWLLAVPAGIGFATLRACLKLCIGFPPDRSGVRSAGNGPAMRSAGIGAFFAGDRVRIADFVQISTRITHTDPRAETGALAIALCAESAILDRSASETLALLSDSAFGDAEWQEKLRLVREALDNGWTQTRLCAALGCPDGVTGYIYHTVPVAVFAFLKAADFRSALEEVLDCGGDTDTAGAIAGALLGCRFGARVIPGEWMARIMEFPKGIAHLQYLAGCLDKSGSEINTVRAHSWWLLPARQSLFTVTVLIHGFRRLLPPW
jgi:ADP-ribosylglycohydrolase